MRLISVIVPVYNVENYIDKCIESIINQTYTELEIILINDGSRDLSGEICNKYAKQDKRVIVIHTKNKGVSEARNTGIEVAKGEYLAFVDSDDWIEKNMIEKLYNLATLYNADIVQGNYVRIFDEIEYKQENIKEKLNFLTSEEMLLNLYNKDVMIKNIVIWNKLYNAQLFKKIRFPKGIIHEDEAIVYKLYNNSRKIIDINTNIYYYRHTENSIINKKIDFQNLDLIYILEERERYFKENNLSNLVKKNDVYIYNILINYYIQVLRDKEIDYKLVKMIKSEMRKKYLRVILNKDIKISGKIGFSLAILNKNLFYKIISTRNNYH